jgi:hypothetical protein
VANELRTAIAREWGLRVNVIVLTQRAVEVRRQRRDPLIANILQEGFDISIDPRKDRKGAPARAKTTG